MEAITDKLAGGEADAGGFLSLGINMTGRRCLVVGGGRIGTRKALALHEAGAEVVVVSPRISQDIRELAALEQIGWHQREYRQRDQKHAFLVVAATSDAPLNTRIGIDAKKRGILCCVVSSAADSSVVFPAVHADAGITVAVHSNGRDCRRSKRIRDALGAWFSRAESFCRYDGPEIEPAYESQADRRSDSPALYSEAKQ